MPRYPYRSSFFFFFFASDLSSFCRSQTGLNLTTLHAGLVLWGIFFHFPAPVSPFCPLLTTLVIFKADAVAQPFHVLWFPSRSQNKSQILNGLQGSTGADSAEPPLPSGLIYSHLPHLFHSRHTLPPYHPRALASAVASVQIAPPQIAAAPLPHFLQASSSLAKCETAAPNPSITVPSPLFIFLVVLIHSQLTYLRLFVYCFLPSLHQNIISVRSG